MKTRINIHDDPPRTWWRGWGINIKWDRVRMVLWAMVIFVGYVEILLFWPEVIG